MNNKFYLVSLNFTLINRVGIMKKLLKEFKEKKRANKQQKLLQDMFNKANPLNLIIGSGGLPQDGWITTDIDILNVTKREDWEKYFKIKKVDAIFAEHVWEHLTEDEAIAATKHCYTYLKTGGYIRMAVPDGFNPDKDYIDHVKVGSDEHKVLYNYKTLTELFQNAGFEVELYEYYNENNEFICKDWDSSKGLIRRSKNQDHRNKDGKLAYTSIVLDGFKR